MSELATEQFVESRGTQLLQKPESDPDTSRARLSFSSDFSHAHTRGRKPKLTPEKVDTICLKLSEGETERAACLLVGIGQTVWNQAKRESAELRERIATARAVWGQLQHERHKAALYQSQVMRAAGRKASRPQPIYQAKLVTWCLTTRVPLNIVAIPEQEIINACEQFNLSLDSWNRQNSAFGLMAKIYAKRAKIRGQTRPQQPTFNQPRTVSQWWEQDDAEEEYAP